MKNKNLIFSKFLTRSLVKNFLAIFTILCVIIFGNQIFIVLNHSLKEGLLGSEILPLVALKFFRDIPFIICFSFSLAIVYSLNKLYKSSELIILSNAGLNDWQLFKMIKMPFLSFTLIVFLMSLFFIPLVKQHIDIFKINAKNRPDFIFFKENIFQNFQGEKIVFYSSEVESVTNSENQLLKNIFIYNKENDRLILAENGLKEIDLNTDNVYLNLKQGKIFDGLDKKDNVSISSFDDFVINLFSPADNVNAKDFNKSEFKSVISLIKSNNRFDMIELLSRFSIPISIVLMSALSVFLSKTNPRNKKNFALGYGLLTYIIYYNFIIYTQELVLENKSLTLLNMGIPHITVFLIIIAMYLYRNKIILKT